MKRATRRAGWIIALLAMAGVVAWLARPAAVPVETAPVTRGPMRVTVDEEGETRIHPRHVVDAPVAGRLAAIELDEGDPVRAGQTVARITPRPLDQRAREQADAMLRAARAVRAEAEARVAEARASLEMARRTLARSERLAAEGQLAAEDLDRARTDETAKARALEAAAFRADAARCEWEGARAALMERGRGATLDVCSPADGVVLRVFEDSERVVPAGAPLMEVGDPAKLEVVVDVLSTEAVAITPGAQMLLDAGEGRMLQGRVRLVEPSGFTKVSPLGVEEQRVNVVGDLTAPAEGLGDRFRVETGIVVWEGEDVLKAPAGAVIRSGDEWAVYEVLDGRARRRAVRIGHRNSREVEILEGIAEGRTVIVYPGEQVGDGIRVAATPSR